jgi:hypothetical protein
MKPAPTKVRSIPNVIPFGDWTVDEMRATADLFGVPTKVAYRAAQEPIEANLVEEKTNPGIEGVTEAFWVPLSKSFTGIDPEAEFKKRLEVPADQLSVVANSAANSQDLQKIRNDLRKVMATIKKIWEGMSTADWNEEKFEGYWKNLSPADKQALVTKVGGQKKGDVRRAIIAGKLPEVTATFDPYSKTGYTESPYWKAVKKLVLWLENPAGTGRDAPPIPFTIFTEGSSKLPFFQWSTVPGATCPGAGRCWTKDPEDRGNGKKAPKGGPRGYCYSLSGWRNVVPYLRQLQNTIMMRLPSKATIINTALKQVQAKEPKAVVRLYVDGDFDSLETLEFWMHICERYPQMRFYGYSKSWDIFLAWDKKHNGKWPANYLLNLSNGSFYERLDSPKGDPNNPYNKIMDQMLALGCARGRFVAIRMPKGIPNGEAPKLPKDEVEQNGEKIEDPRFNPVTREKLRLHRQAVADEAVRQGIPLGKNQDRFFTCPGLCGFCLGPYEGAGDPEGTHACGFDKYRGKTILIAVH